MEPALLTTILMTVSVLAGATAVYFSMRLPRLLNDERGDTGPAIVAFGRAYPTEPIRDVLMTSDERTVFLRLFDGNTGCVQSSNRYMTCRIIKPGGVSVSPGTSSRSLNIEFTGSGLESGEFFFSSEDRTAELALWLLGSLQLKMPDAADSDANEAENGDSSR